MMEDDADLREQIFHNNVREYIIFLLFFLVLYLSSYALLCALRRIDRDDPHDEDEDTVYRISVWLCAFSLAVAVGAALLLPISIVANEVLLLYPSSYYVKWLNSSLIQGLWNLIFLFSNVALFIMLPFTYLFTESEGFLGVRKGVMGRAYEAGAVLAMLGVVMLGIAYILVALFDQERAQLVAFFDVWNFYLPFLYSCVAFVGVLLLLLCTPLGFARLFTVVGGLIEAKPQFLLRHLMEDGYKAKLEEESLVRRLKEVTLEETRKQQRQIGRRLSLDSSPSSLVEIATLNRPVSVDDINTNLSSMKLCDIRMNGIQKRNETTVPRLMERLQEAEAERKKLEKLQQASTLHRTLTYPLAMLALLLMTAVAVLLVLHNTLQLLVGIKALPLKQVQQFSLGLSSLSSLGPPGAAIQVVLIVYLLATSLVGLYSLPFVHSLRPKKHQTPLAQLVLNCAIVLILSCALPLLARILGLTNFDLLGDFGRIEWLGNFHLVLLYNAVFAITTVLCLVKYFTMAVWAQIGKNLRQVGLAVVHRLKGKSLLRPQSSPKED